MVINLFNSVDHGGSVSKVLQEEGDLGKPKQTILKIYKKIFVPTDFNQVFWHIFSKVKTKRRKKIFLHRQKLQFVFT